MEKMAKYKEGSVASVLLHITGLANVQHFARLPLINKPPGRLNPQYPSYQPK